MSLSRNWDVDSRLRKQDVYPNSLFFTGCQPRIPLFVLPLVSSSQRASEVPNQFSKPSKLGPFHFRTPLSRCVFAPLTALHIPTLPTGMCPVPVVVDLHSIRIPTPTFRRRVDFLRPLHHLGRVFRHFAISTSATGTWIRVSWRYLLNDSYLHSRLAVHLDLFTFALGPYRGVYDIAPLAALHMPYLFFFLSS